MKQVFIRADDLLLDSFRLAVSIFQSDFKPDFLVGLWRGGSSVGIAVQEGLEYLGVTTDHIAIRTSYSGRDNYSKRTGADSDIQVHGLQYLLENLQAEHSLLIVDDVYSTGSSVAAVIAQLSRKLRRNLPSEIRTAAVWFRPGKHARHRLDYHIHTTADWLVLPYELNGLSQQEIRMQKPELNEILDELRDYLPAPTPVSGGSG